MCLDPVGFHPPLFQSGSGDHGEDSGEAATLLALMVRDPLHVYLKSLRSPSDDPCIRAFERVLGSRQVTDAYLLSLARQHRAKLMTFDARLRAATRNDEELEVLAD